MIVLSKESDFVLEMPIPFFKHSQGQSSSNYLKMLSLVSPLTPVEVYRNLTKKCWSVRQKGKVRFHTDYVVLVKAKFVVQPAGREKVRRERSKTVHAFVKGTLVHPRSSDADWKEDEPVWPKVSYNPYKNDTFVRLDTGEAVLTADYVDMYYGDVIAKGIK